MSDAAVIVLAGGTQEIGAVFWAALAAAVLAVAAAGVSAVLLFAGIARWRQVRGEDTGLPDLPRGGPELHEDVAEVIRGWAAEWDRQKGDRRG